MKNTFVDIFLALKLFRVWTTLSKFDLIKKYKRSILGPWWITLTTLILILSVAFIYSGIFQMNLDQYILNLSLNFIIWVFIRDCILESCNSLVESKFFLLNEKFNIIVLSLRVIYRNILIFFHNIIIFLVIIFYFNLNFNFFYILISLFSLVLVPFFLLPICISLSIICTRFRDMQMIVNNLMQFLFFVSPVLFTKSALVQYEWLMLINPIALLLLCISEPITLGVIHSEYFQILFFYILVAYSIFTFIYCKYKSKITYWL